MTEQRISMLRAARSLGLIAIAAIVLVGCRAEEQGRLIRYEQGVYKGKPDTELSQAQLEELRARARKQAGASGAGFSGGGKAQDSGEDVRIPGELNTRTQNQGGAK